MNIVIYVNEKVFSITFQPPEASNYPDIWFYYFNMNWLDGFVTEDECFPVVFKDGKVSGWGHAYYTRYRIENREKIDVVDLKEKK